MASAIYAIVNQTTRDMYVGSAVDVNRRWSSHRSKLRKQAHYSKHLQNAFIKYGETNVHWEIVEYVANPANLIKREQFWLNFFQPVYNKRKIAESCFGLKRSDEAKQRMAQAQLGKKQSAETIAKRSAALKGRARPPEVRAKISAGHLGITPNAETRAKMSESAKRRKSK